MKKTILLLLFSVSLFGQSELKIMSYNIRLGSANDGENNWELRKEKVVSLLYNYDADFIGLQEAQKFQLDYILSNLPEYALIGLPREEGEFAEYSCILYKKSSFKVEEQKTLWLSETPEKTSRGWDAACNRIVTYGRFKYLKSKKQFWIANTHFDHIGRIAREQSAQLLNDLGIDLTTKKQIPLILTGDFNAESTDVVINELKKVYFDSYETSIAKPYGPKGTWNAFDFAKPIEKRIDYIFYIPIKEFQVQKIAIIDDFYDFKYPSDHLPVLTIFKL